MVSRRQKQSVFALIRDTLLVFTVLALAWEDSTGVVSVAVVNERLTPVFNISLRLGPTPGNKYVINRPKNRGTLKDLYALYICSPD